MGFRCCNQVELLNGMNNSLIKTNKIVLVSEKAKIIASHAPISNSVAIVISFLFFYVLRDDVDVSLLGLWTSLITLMAMIRLWIWHNLDNEEPSTWLRNYSFISLILGVLWSAIFLFVSDETNVVLVGSLFMLYFGVIAAAYSALVVYLPIYFLYTLPSTISLVVVLYRFDEQVYLIMSFASILFYSMMAMFAKNTNKNLIEMIFMEIENESLVNKLESEIDERDQLVLRKTKQLQILNSALFQSEDQLKNVINGANLGYWDWNFQTGSHEVNERWLEMLGLKFIDIKNNISDWDERIHPDDKDRVTAIVKRHINEKTSYTTDFRMKHKDGHWVWIQGSGAVVEYDEETNQPNRLCGTHKDISSRKELEQQLEYQATHDELTGLLNRNELWKNLDAEIKRASRYKHHLSLFLIDIDDFKKINDQFGHKNGDIVLREFTKMLLSETRETDFSARYGGEEFVVILPETALKKAQELADRLCQKVSEAKISIEQKDLSITLSIGVATFPEHGSLSNELLDTADKAMYQAKESGKNCVKIAQALADLK